MDYTEKIKELFLTLSWINISQLADHIQMDRKNMVKYTSGKLAVSEKNYNKIMQGLAELKAQMP